MTKSSENKFYIQSIHRALSIVDLISKSDSGVTLSEISKGLSLPMSTSYRIIENLIYWNYVHEENGFYTLGYQLITLGNKANKNLGIKEVARKYLQELNEITGKTIFLAVLDEENANAIYIDKIESKSNIKLATEIGSRNHLHSTSNGKALMLEHNDEKIIKLINKSGMPKLTQNTKTNINELLEEIHESRKKGYTVDNIENEQDVKCISAPIYDCNNKITASLSISGLFSNMTNEIIENQYKYLVINTADKISKELGYKKQKITAIPQ